MSAEVVVSKTGQRHFGESFTLFVYFVSTLFMVFFSVHSVQKWPGFWGQGMIIVFCLLPAGLTFYKVVPEFLGNKKWPDEIRFVLIILILGLLNICFSEDQPASFKGMVLFIISGVMVFASSYFLLDSKRSQSIYFNLCSVCFIVLLFFGFFEAVQQFNEPDKRILLFSSNPIPAGSLLILLAIGPLNLVVQAKHRWKKILWASCLLAGILLIILIAQRGPVLALAAMVFAGIIKWKRGGWTLILVALVFAGIGYQFKNHMPHLYKNQLLNSETVFVRLEFYYIAIEAFKEKPLFGLGFNSPLSRFIPNGYKPKIYSKNNKHSFRSMTNGIKVFDNMFLSFLGEMGGLFTLAYIGLLVQIMKNITKSGSVDAKIQPHFSLLVIVMIGFCVHSLTFDSLKYPHLNWMFHSLLGLMSRSQDFKQAVDG